MGLEGLGYPPHDVHGYFGRVLAGFEAWWPILELTVAEFEYMQKRCAPLQN
jgi:hypothetical protein